jgi:peptide-methionine (S)-S-oxide reductase
MLGMTAENKLASRIVTGLSILLVLWGTVSCTPATGQASGQTSAQEVSAPLADTLQTAVFAGGCFWCMEKPFDELPGVASTTSGYTGGRVENPTYEEVSAGGTGHFEAIEVRYDPKQVSYETLLKTFWVNVDPVDSRGQFCDKGDQYRSAIFYESPEQQAMASASKEAIATQLAQPIATEVIPAAPFYAAEDYHQNYYQTHATRYKVYRFSCGRDQRLTRLWGADAPAH